MNWVYESLGDKLSNTDPISNSVLISGLNFERDGAKIIQAGSYPIKFIGSYIHESFHHMCFRSPVGSAIAHLYHRGFLRASRCIFSDVESTRGENNVLEDIVRVETVLHVMRPLAEGIALFGEFDAWPGQSKSLSEVFLKTAVAFGDTGRGFEDRLIPEVLKDVLAYARSQPSTQKRKENLLMQGFTTQNGGYLPGYFMIKNLQFALFRQTKSDLLLDSEFYLNFIVRWFYGDYRLVESLLDTSRKIDLYVSQRAVVEHDPINAICMTFQQRVSDLFRLTAEQISLFDERQVSESVVPWWKSQIGMDPADARKIENELFDEINRLLDYSDVSVPREERAMRSLCHDNFVRRNYLCLGSFEDQVVINENGRIKFARSSADQDFPVMVFGTSEKPGPFTGRATFDILQSGLSGKVFFVVYADNERVLCDSLTENFDAERSSLESVNLSTAQCQETKTVMSAIVDSALERDEIAKIYRSHYRDNASDITDAMYKNWCGALMSSFGPEANISADPGALLVICGGDTKFLRTVAALSCVGGPLVSEDSVAEACKQNGFTVEEFRRRAKAIEDEHKLCFMYQLGQFTCLTV